MERWSNQSYHVGNKRPRNVMHEQGDGVLIMPGFEKVWRMAESQHFSGTRRYEKNGVAMYFWLKHGFPFASTTAPHGYAENDNIFDPAFRSSLRNDD